jgi:hypothetical protein
MGLLAASPAIHAITDRPKELPFYLPGRDRGALAYSPDAKNGHKCSVYAFNAQAMAALASDNPDAVLIFMVRSAESALMSWRQMHASIARKGEVAHRVTRDEDSRRFFQESSIDEYFKFVRRRLRYADAISRVLENHPAANYLIVAQARLSTDSRAVLTRIHELMGAPISQDYLDRLPAGHKPRGSRAKGDSGVSAAIARALERNDDALLELAERLDPARVMLSGDGGL